MPESGERTTSLSAVKRSAAQCAKHGGGGHGAAVMYRNGIRFDENPFYFFSLRGIDPDRFISVAVESSVERMLKNADVVSDRIIGDANLTELFGVV